MLKKKSKLLIVLLALIVMSTTSYLVYNAFAAKISIKLWHAYRGDEKKAIETLKRQFNSQSNKYNLIIRVVPFDAINDKLRTSIPMGRGPDVFIFAQDFVGSWADNNLIVDMGRFIRQENKSRKKSGKGKFMDQFFYNTKRAFLYKYRNAVWGVPGAFKNLALFYNKNLLSASERKRLARGRMTIGRLVKICRRFTKPKEGSFGRWGFPYEMGNFYYHTMWIQGYGGEIFKKKIVRGKAKYLPKLNTKAHKRAALFILKLKNANITPPACDNVLTTQLFNTGMGLFTINGQWFRGEINKKINYGIAPLPLLKVGRRYRRAVPFLTAEGYFMSRSTRKQRGAFEVIKYCTSPAAGKTMSIYGKQTPSNKNTYKLYAAVREDPINRVFKQQAAYAVPMPNCPAMALAWDPCTSALTQILGIRSRSKSAIQRQINRVLRNAQLKLEKLIRDNKK